MAFNIENMGPSSGRKLREDSSVINMANILAPGPAGEPEELSVTSAAAVSLASIPTGAIGAVVQLDQPVRFSLSGTPTAAAGLYAAANQPIYLESAEELAGFRVIAVNAAAAGWVEYRG